MLMNACQVCTVVPPLRSVGILLGHMNAADLTNLLVLQPDRLLMKWTRRARYHDQHYQQQHPGPVIKPQFTHRLQKQAPVLAVRPARRINHQEKKELHQ